MRKNISLANIKKISANIIFLFLLGNDGLNYAQSNELKTSNDYSSDKILWEKIINHSPKEKVNKEDFKLKKTNQKTQKIKNEIKNRYIKAHKKNKDTVIIKRYELENLIKSNSAEIKIMEARVNEARYLLKSELASWYPKLNLSSNGFPQYLKGNVYNDLSTNTSSDQKKASIKATLKWDIINPSRIPQISAARDQFENSRIAYSIKLRDLLLEANTQYFNLQKSFQDIRIAKDSIETSKISLKEARVKFKSGLISKLEVLEAKTQLYKDKQLLTEKLGMKKINQRKFAQLLNLDQNISPKINSEPRIIGIWEPSLEESIDSGYKYRKELDQLKRKVSINNNKAKIARSTNQPKVSIYNTFDSSISKGEIASSSPRTNNSINSTSNTVGIQFEWPIFDGGYGKSKYYASKEKVKELESQFYLKKTQIRKEIEEAFFKLEIAQKNIKNSFEAIQSAKESLRLSILRLQAGITTQREVITSQRDLTQAEVNYIKSITDFNTNIISLERKTGLRSLNDCTKISIERKSLNTDKLNYKNSLEQLSFDKDTCMELL
ncbi:MULTISPECIES: TolC family protein [unclassified Prochlorococcus]|uniref:TolC family protein n=1 Tax=unclassified Prochlorococcus TaxID=2627481 RepID=UPI000533BC38|nr:MULTISPECIES: TolC family protein [unclassified Prochlorococcus]KGG16841.1 Outer membrane efflux protein precursor [Prochlorococcus sp. MIT 0602]KGG18185.1 Outer membrane efflux protein precursor [Prochlorococcus sp. MIT 0603]